MTAQMGATTKVLSGCFIGDNVEIADTVLFLCGSSYITGTVLDIYGGVANG